MKELLKIKQVKWVLKAIPHVSIIISGMLIVFFCIDRVNKPMAFMTNEFHKVITFILALMSLGYSVFIISYQRRMERLEYEKRVRAAQARRQAAARNSVPAQGRPVQPVRPPQRSAQPARPAQSRPAQAVRTPQGR